MAIIKQCHVIKEKPKRFTFTNFDDSYFSYCTYLYSAFSKEASLLLLLPNSSIFTPLCAKSIAIKGLFVAAKFKDVVGCGSGVEPASCYWKRDAGSIPLVHMSKCP